MVYAKTQLFNNELQSCAEFCKALAHPARLAILKYLAEIKTCISGDISNHLPLSRSTVTQHLRELKELGLIRGEIDGHKINYCLCNSKIIEYKQMFDDFFKDMAVDDINCETVCE